MNAKAITLTELCRHIARETGTEQKDRDLIGVSFLRSFSVKGAAIVTLDAFPLVYERIIIQTGIPRAITLVSENRQVTFSDPGNMAIMTDPETLLDYLTFQYTEYRELSRKFFTWERRTASIAFDY